jgi:DNA-binding SARP family transcriptional activator/tetratricopeptide (TPR) repeat protein
VEFRLLGGVEVHDDAGRVFTLPRRHERCLLAILLLDVGHRVPIERLCDLLWDDTPPAQARSAVHTYVARIRAMLALADPSRRATLISRRGGYLVTADPAMIDVHQFQALLALAGRTDDLTERARYLEQTLLVWRGPPLEHAATPHLRARLCADLEQLHHRAVEDRLTVGLALGHGRDLLPELARLVVEHPTRERLLALHVRALYQEGRTDEALDVYTTGRARLADLLGLDPGPELQSLHQLILRGQPLPASSPTTTSTQVRPAQLPRDRDGFVGRAEHLAHLDSLLAQQPGTMVISTIAGTAGVGKTTLAVHWAHRVRNRYPDGQLYLNLRGFDPTGQAMQPTEAVRRLLDALGVPHQRIPADLEEQSALYRKLVTGKRLLVLLDNARDSAQVRPLLPGTPGSLAVVTTRNQLTGLIVVNGAHPVILDVLRLDEARQLLTDRIGAGRTSAEPDAVDRLVTLCSRLPLALAIVAAQAVHQPDRPLTDLADELDNSERRLSGLTGDDPYTDIRTVFSWSYHALTPDTARMFRLLGIHPGPEISLPAAASLTGLTAEDTTRQLHELASAHLVIEHTPGRYTLHDLLRAYATDLATSDEPEPDQHAATRRMLDHYTHTAATAALLLAPLRTPTQLGPIEPGAQPEQLDDYAQAMAWFATEHPVLLEAVDHAEHAGLDPYVGQLAWAMADFLDRHGHWHDRIRVQRSAIKASQRMDDQHGEASAHRGLAVAYGRQGRFEQARTHHTRARDLYEQLGDLVGQANAHRGLAAVAEQQDRYAEALDHAEHTLVLSRAAGDRPGQARALNAVGWYQTLLGDHHEAIASCQAALTILQELGDQFAEAATWDSLGHAHHHLHDHPSAITAYQQAIDLCRELADRYYEATCLTSLGETHLAAGNPSSARQAWREALHILTDLNHPDADNVQAHLAALDAEPPPPLIQDRPTPKA